MTFHAYRATAFSHTHENHVFNQLYDLLQQHWGGQHEPLHLLGNFYIDGVEVDALIIKRNAIIVIDFKDYGGSLKFSENGRWLINGNEVRGGNKSNPYQQIRDNKFQLLNYLKEYVSFQSSPNFGHIAGLCVFHQSIDFDSSSLPHNVSRWFHIADMNSIVRATDAIVSTAINFSDTDIKSIINQLDIPSYSPDGRPVEELIEPYGDLESSDSRPLNNEQNKAFLAISNWLDSSKSKVFSLSGPYYSGKKRVLEKTLKMLTEKGKVPIILAPNARIANRYKGEGLQDVSSVYSWLYAGRPSDIKNGKAIYPISHEPVNTEKNIIVILEAHLLGDDLFETETIVYGTGYILQDLINSLRGKKLWSKTVQSELELKELPKILLIGDPYQLNRGGKDKNLLTCKIFEQEAIPYNQEKLNSQDRDEDAPVERLDFQKVLISQLKAKKFMQLPICEQGTITTIIKGGHTDNIANALLRWPKTTSYLCATNETACSVNYSIRKKYLNAASLGILVKGDIIDIHNRTPYIHSAEVGLDELKWVNAGEFALVVSVEHAVETKSINLKGRDTPVVVEFSKAEVEYSGGVASILYLPDFLAAKKPELTQDQQIALQIWAKQEADAALEKEKNELDRQLEFLGQDSPEYKEKLQVYRERHTAHFMSSKYSNAARIRYAYALTVHRAQSYDAISRVVLDGSAAHDTENPATDSYFRWLYTATVCTSDILQILDYPVLTPLSKTEWHFNTVQFAPLTFKPTLYYEKDREPTETELATPLPNGFSNPEPNLLALLLKVYELIEKSKWQIEGITQHNYKERYLFSYEQGQVLVDLDYNGNYDVSIGVIKVISGEESLAGQVKLLLTNEPVYRDKGISEAVDIFKDYISKKGWLVVNSDEKNYKVFLIVSHECGRVKLELNVPSDRAASKKGIISSVKVQQADNSIVSKKFESDFAIC